jgi:hypothetical protein
MAVFTGKRFTQQNYSWVVRLKIRVHLLTYTSVLIFWGELMVLIHLKKLMNGRKLVSRPVRLTLLGPSLIQEELNTADYSVRPLHRIETIKADKLVRDGRLRSEYPLKKLPLSIRKQILRWYIREPRHSLLSGVEPPLINPEINSSHLRESPFQHIREAICIY